MAVMGVNKQTLDYSRPPPAPRRNWWPAIGCLVASVIAVVAIMLAFWLHVKPDWDKGIVP
jgi:hypothetical protein